MKTLTEKIYSLYQSPEIQNSRISDQNRPWVIMSMICAIDGSTSTKNTSSGYGNQTDKSILNAMRSVADIILVGANTVRLENYGPVILSDTVQKERQNRGQQVLPKFAIVSSQSMDTKLRIYSDVQNPPLWLDASTYLQKSINFVGEKGSVKTFPIIEMLETLHKEHAKIVVCEGGPTLNAQLASAQAIDEICITISPFLFGGMSSRILSPISEEFETAFSLEHTLRDEDYLFLRYIKK